MKAEECSIRSNELNYIGADVFYVALSSHRPYPEQHFVTVDYIDGNDLGNLGHLIDSIDNANILLVQDTIIFDPSGPEY